MHRMWAINRIKLNVWCVINWIKLNVWCAINRIKSNVWCAINRIMYYHYLTLQHMTILAIRSTCVLSHTWEREHTPWLGTQTALPGTHDKLPVSVECVDNTLLCQYCTLYTLSRHCPSKHFSLSFSFHHAHTFFCSTLHAPISLLLLPPYTHLCSAYQYGGYRGGYDMQSYANPYTAATMGAYNQASSNYGPMRGYAAPAGMGGGTTDVGRDRDRTGGRQAYHPYRR